MGSTRLSISVVVLVDRRIIGLVKGWQEANLKPFLNHSTLLMPMLLVFWVACMTMAVLLQHLWFHGSLVKVLGL